MAFSRVLAKNLAQVALASYENERQFQRMIRREAPRFNGGLIDLDSADLLTDSNNKADSEVYTMRTTRGDVIIAFRGSEITFKKGDGSIKDWLQTDLDAFPIKYPLYDGNAGFLGSKIPYTHGGFWDAYNVIRGELRNSARRQIARSKKKHPTLFITGHSLGGALSIHAGTELGDEFPKSKIKVYTYGAPRVGNNDFCKLFNNRVEEAFLIANKCDPAPFVPPLGVNINISEKRYKHPSKVKYMKKNGDLKNGLPTAKPAFNLIDHRLLSYIDQMNESF